MASYRQEPRADMVTFITYCGYMETLTKTPHTIRKKLPPLLLASILGLSACSGDNTESSSNNANSSNNEQTNEQPLDEADATTNAPDPVKILPDQADVPTDYRMLPATCEDGRPDDPERSIESNDDTAEDEEPDYSTWITYTVPETWDTAGRGRAGSGGVTGSDEDLTFKHDDGNGAKGRIKISVNWDSKNAEGTITNNSGEPWETFDYDSTIGDDRTTIIYDNVATLQAGEQETDLFYMDQSQAPNHVSNTEYKLRLEAFQLPHQNIDGEYELLTETFVATVEFDQDDLALDQETVETITESFVLPQCSYDYALEDAELILGVDLNNDGHIRDADDIQEELQEMLDEAQAEHEEELQNSEED